MPFHSDASAVPQINAYLDAMLDSGASFQLGLLTGDPRLGGVEITGSGYARLSRVDDATFWEAADEAMKRSLVQTFAAPTADDWDTATYEGRWFAGVLVDFAPLGAPVESTGALVAPKIRVVRRFNNVLAD